MSCVEFSIENVKFSFNQRQKELVEEGKITMKMINTVKELLKKFMEKASRDIPGFQGSSKQQSLIAVVSEQTLLVDTLPPTSNTLAVIRDPMKMFEKPQIDIENISFPLPALPEVITFRPCNSGMTLEKQVEILKITLKRLMKIYQTYINWYRTYLAFS